METSVVWVFSKGGQKSCEEQQQRGRVSGAGELQAVGEFVRLSVGENKVLELGMQLTEE